MRRMRSGMDYGSLKFLPKRGKSAEFEDEARAARERAAELLSKLSAVSAERDAARAYADSLKEDLKDVGEKNAAEKLLAAAESAFAPLQKNRV
ncbi:MAG: hypothetical protein ACLUKN_08985 [Bacilli bacterium]